MSGLETREPAIATKVDRSQYLNPYGLLHDETPETIFTEDLRHAALVVLGRREGWTSLGPQALADRLRMVKDSHQAVFFLKELVGAELIPIDPELEQVPETAGPSGREQYESKGPIDPDQVLQ